MSHTSMIDRFVEIVPNKSVIATRGLTLTEDVFGCHFPNFPILPGVLMIHALQSVSSQLIKESERFNKTNRSFLVKRAEKIKFKKYARPGDVLIIKAEIIEQNEKEVCLTGSIDIENEKIFQVKKLIYTLAEEDRHEK